MKFQEVEFENNLTGVPDKHIIIDLGNGAFKSFPADESNPEYVAYLASLEETPDASA
jgi:hypothetical protein